MILPKRLFKYKAFDQSNYFEDLLNGNLYFPSPIDFNDPFDCMILEKYHEGSKDQKFQKAIEILSYENPNKRHLEIRKLAKAHLQKNPDLFNDKKQNEINIMNFVDKNIGVYSLTSNMNDILMWGHYAESHKGFCIEFDAHELNNFISKLALVNKRIIYLKPVEYSKTYPIINPYIEDHITRMDKQLFTKSISWKYEKEWRILYFEGSRLKIKFPFTLIKAIYLGLRTTNDNKSYILKKFEDFTEIKIYKAQKKEFEYGLTFQPIR